jgi:hypothetical protein
LHSKSDDTEQRGLVVQETKKGTLKTYTDLDGNKVEELWKNYAADGKSQVNLFLRTKTFYKGNPPKRVKKETYYMADKNLKTREYFDENENINISEHYYLRLQTIKKGKRETLLREKRYFYGDCMCVENYEGKLIIQSRRVLKSDGELVSVNRTSEGQDLSCNSTYCR